MEAMMPTEFMVCALNGESVKVSVSDIETAGDLKSMLREMC